MSGRPAPKAATAAAPPASNEAPPARRIAAQAAFEVRSIVRNGEQLLLSVLVPVGVLIALSTTRILDAVGADPQAGPRVDVATAGVLGLAIASTAFAGQAIATAFERRYGVLRQLATTPLGAGGLVLGKLIAVCAVVASQFALIFAIAAALGFSAHVSVPGVLLAGVLGTASLVSLALLMAGTLRAEATLAGANIVWVLMAGAGGILIAPPGLWGQITAILPFGALSDAMRAAVLAGTIDWPALAVMAIWAVLGVAGCRAWFSFDGR